MFYFLDIETGNILCFYFKIKKIYFFFLDICISNKNIINIYFEKFGLKNCSCVFIVMFLIIFCLILEFVGEIWIEVVMVICLL